MSSVNEWPMVKLGDIQRKVSSINPAKSPDQEFSLYSIPAYDSGAPEKALGSAIKSNKIELQPGDTLLSKIVPHIRRSWIVDEHETSSIGSSEWIVYQDDRLDSRFLRNFFLSDYFHAQFMQTVAGVGGSLNRARPAAVAQISIPIPPRPEQQRIAEILDTISSNLASRKTQLEQLSTLQKSTFEQFHLAHLDQATKYHFKDVVPRIDSGKSPVCESRPAADNEWGVLKLSAVTTGEFLQDENKAYLEDTESLSHLEIQLGDLLMTRKNTPELVGAVSLVRETRPNLMLPDLIFRLNLNKDLVKPEYLAALLMSPPVRFSIRSLAGGSAKSMSNISKQRLNKLLIDLPPLNAQREFATKSQEIQAIKRKVNSAYKLDQELLASLQAHAFAGHL